MRAAAAIAALVVALGSAAPVQAADLRIAISKQRAPRRAYPKALLRGIRDAFADDQIVIVDHRRLVRTMRKMRIPRGERGAPESLGRAARRMGVAYVVDVSLSRQRRDWVATTRIIRGADGVVVKTTSTRYDDPRREARERGRIIGYGVIAYMASAAPPTFGGPAVAIDDGPAAREVPAAESFGFEDEGFGDDESAGTFASEDEEAFFTDDGDSGAAVAVERLEGAEPDALSFLGFDWTLRGYASSTYRGFFHGDLEDDKNRNFAKVGVRPTLTGRTSNGLRIRVLPRLEMSVIEPRLHRAMIEEGFVEYASDRVEVRLGFDALTWGAASTINIADVINARDFSEGYADAPKIGQPMLSTRFFLGNHSLTVLYMTPFVSPRFAPPTSPFSPYAASVLDEASYGNIVYGSELGAWHPQGAARLALAFHRLDVRASYFYGYRRTPIAHQATNSLVFPLVHHGSLETQVLFGQTAFKVELSSIWHQRTAQTDRPDIRLDNGAMAAAILLPGHRIGWVAGVEHNFDDVFGTTLTLVAELFGDSDSELFTDDIPPDDSSRFFSNHVVYGARWALNNDVDARVEISDLMDITHPSDHLLRLEYAERWFDDWTFALGGQLGIAQDGTKMTTFRKLSGVYSEIRYNF